ncbi:GntR family transcriptional regulator [Streptomyces sp. NPDC003660]
MRSLSTGQTPAKSRRGGHVPQGSPRGTYLQVSEALRQKIETGEIAEALPSQAALMGAYDVSRSTIERALAAQETQTPVDLAGKRVESMDGGGWCSAETRNIASP